MAAYGVNQAYASTGNPLCDRLKRKYADRGAAQVTRRTASTSTMIKRVQHGLDPYENAPNPLTEKRPVAQAAMQRRQMADARVSSAPAKAGAASARPAVKSAAAGAKSAPTVKTAAKPMPQKKADAKSAAVRTEIKRSRSADKS